MVQHTKAAKRGIELPFTTVEGGLQFGAQKVAEHLQQMQEEAMQQTQVQQQGGEVQAQQASFFNPQLSLENEPPLNFNDFLEEYQQELERNLELAEQAQEASIQKGNKEDDDLDKEREDDFDLDNDLDGEDIGENDLDKADSLSKSKRRNDRKKTNSKNRSEKKSKSQSLKSSRNQQRNNRDRASSIEDKVTTKKVTLSSQQQQKEAEKNQQTKKVITARNTEIVAKNNYTGQDITRTTEKMKDQPVTGGNKAPDKGKSPIAKGSIANKIAEAKLNVQVKGIVQNAAMMTHQTGRTTEFKIGKDTLRFEREGQDTFAMKNGKKVPIDVAEGMLKQLGKNIGPRAMEQMTQIVKVAQQNPAVKTLSQHKKETAERGQTQEQSVKVVKVHSR